MVFVAGLAPFLEGFMRKLKAFFHSRIGPPIYQPYLDIIKLLGKEDLRASENFLFGLAPIVCFGATLTASLFVPFGYTPALSGSGDMIAFIYLITLSSVAIFLGGLASGNPYAGVGSARELMMLFTVEPVLAITLVVASIKANSMLMTELPISGFSISLIISAIGFFLTIQAQMSKLPFDIVEADQEIMGGPFIEYSGPGLALFKWSFYIKEFIFASLFWRVFINWPDFHKFDMPGTLATGLNTAANFVEVLIVLTLVEIIDVTNPRLRIDQSLRYFGTVIFMVMCGLGFAFIGS
ncbi:MAG: NADH-quinone oxidoreductase subunit H [Proteobacteria bacterium]|nr:NADH-quinone oxidoreductase subunit H [Pseudomonadota bacterium]